MKEKVEQLLELTGNEATFKKMRDEYIKQIGTQLGDSEPELYEEFISLIINEFKYDHFKNGTIENYMEVYNEEEIDFMLNYYQSDMGKKIVDKSEDMVVKAFELGKSIGNKVADKLTEYYNNYKNDKNDDDKKLY